jgi:arabinofuranosyltransferase
LRTKRGFGRLPWYAWALLCGLAAAALLVWARSRYQFDDAFISYRYAANLFAGRGLVFNPGERVEGYSNLLLVLLMATGLGLGIPPTVSGPLLGVLSLLAILAGGWWVVWKAVEEWTPERRIGASALLFVLPLSHGLASASGSGLETMLFAALIFFAAILWAGEASSPRRSIGVPLLLSLLVLARPDGIVAVATLLFLELGTAAVRARHLANGCVALLRLGMAPVLVAAAQTIWRLGYYGAFYPNPYFAKGADTPQYASGLAYAWAFLLSYPAVPLLLPALALVIVRGGQRFAARLALAGTALLFGYGACLVRVGGDFMDYRLFWHVLPVVLVAEIVAVTDVLGATRWMQAAVTAAVLGLAFVPPRLESVYYMQTLPEMQHYVDDGTLVGKGLARLPQDTVVATTLIGTIGYYSGLRLVDQWGLVDADVRSRPPRQPFVRGHLKFTAASEALRKGADLLLEHPDIRACGPEVLKTAHDAGFRLDDGRCVRALVLSPRDGFRAMVCSDRQRFPVLGSQVCAP